MLQGLQVVWMSCCKVYKWSVCHAARSTSGLNVMLQGLQVVWMSCCKVYKWSVCHAARSHKWPKCHAARSTSGLNVMLYDLTRSLNVVPQGVQVTWLLCCKVPQVVWMSCCRVSRVVWMLWRKISQVVCMSFLHARSNKLLAQCRADWWNACFFDSHMRQVFLPKTSWSGIRVVDGGLSKNLSDFYGQNMNL